MAPVTDCHKLIGLKQYKFVIFQLWNLKWFQKGPHSYLCFPCGSVGKESACNVEDLGSIPRLGRFPGEGKGYPLQYSGLENSMNCKSPYSCFPNSSGGKESTYNAGDPGSIPGSERSTGEGIDYSLQYSCAYLVAQLLKNLPATRETWVGKIPWRRERLPIPGFWPGEFHGL